ASTLHFFRINALSAGADQVVDPTDELEVAVLAQHADVAGEIPSLPQLFRSRVRPLEVTVEGDVRLRVDDELPRLAGRYPSLWPFALAHHAHPRAEVLAQARGPS